ncbi:MAG: hypothetical protein ACPG21_02500 [Crocinitomicaceae bacterium]
MRTLLKTLIAIGLSLLLLLLYTTLVANKTIPRDGWGYMVIPATTLALIYYLVFEKWLFPSKKSKD